MLTTQQDHALPTFPFTAGPGVSTWRAVTLHVGVIYVFVSYSIKHASGGWLPQTTVFWRHEDVLEFCKQCNKDKRRKLLEVFLLMPKTQEAPHQWTFEPVREIFATQDHESDEAFPLYVTAEGETLGALTFGETEDLNDPARRAPPRKVFPI